MPAEAKSIRVLQSDALSGNLSPLVATSVGVHV
jgi:hypothetical protein